MRVFAAQQLQTRHWDFRTVRVPLLGAPYNMFPLMNLTLGPGIAGRNDYYVLDDGRRIGRIFLSPHGPDGHPWFWGIFPPPAGNEGYAATREEAMADLRAAAATADIDAGFETEACRRTDRLKSATPKGL
jgi:hypothetical protein